MTTIDQPAADPCRHLEAQEDPGVIGRRIDEVPCAPLETGDARGAGTMPARGRSDLCI